MTFMFGTPQSSTRRGLLVVMVAVIAVLPGCASLPSSSSPQSLGTVVRGPEAPAVPVPVPGREPQLIVRDFVKASTDPTNSHAAARQFLTPGAAGQWNDGASATIVDKVDVLEDSRDGDLAQYTIRANRVGRLEQGGQYESDDGSFEVQVTMTKIDGEWRLASVPRGVIMDRAQFLSSYQRRSVYFLDPTGTNLVPDPRWVSVARESLAGELVGTLLAGPRAGLGPAVVSRLASVNLSGPITRADGRPGEVGVGIGGVRIDFAGLSDMAPDVRRQLAAQVVWTLAAAEISGPYVLNADGAPLDPALPNGFATAELASFDPVAVAGSSMGLHALVGGDLVRVQDDNSVKAVDGYFGSANNLRSVALSSDGTLVAAVAATGRPSPAAPDALVVGTYGGGAFPVADGLSITRPTWGPDRDAVWAVVDGESVIRAARDPQSGQVTVGTVDSSALSSVGGRIAELRLSRDGTRAALIISGAVYVTTVVRAPSGMYSLQAPTAVASGLGGAALSLDWSTGDTVVVARAGSDVPVVAVVVDGSRLDALPNRNLTVPVVVVDATPTTVFVADSRAVFEIDSADPSSDRYWREVAGLTGSGAEPVLPG